MISSAAVFACLVSLVLYFVFSLLFQKKLPAPLPPGPKPKPLIGNLTDLPPTGEQEWVHWLKHKDRYGPISSVTVLGQTIILLHDAQVAFDLLEKRSIKHSSRPAMVFSGEMCGWENSMAGLLYNNRFREYRKQAHQVLGTTKLVSQFNTLQDIEIRRFLLRVLENPQDLVYHIRTEAGAIILKISYGYTIEPRKQDPLIEVADKALWQFAKAAMPGAWLVDIIPSLKYLPDWIPGAGFKKTAAEWHKTLTYLVNEPFSFVKQQMKRGNNEPSFLSKLLEQNGGNLTTEEALVAKWVTGSMYAGGADTTVSTLSCFFLAMTVFPEVQRKAQEEIDRVIGTGRLPTFEDRENLPYVDAIVKEALRWHPVAPLGLPHVSTEDDTYNGYFIPKGAMLIAGIWGFLHDPKVYHDPMSFKPERFLGENPEPDPHTMSFGFGRRICPGKVLADTSTYLTVAQSLAVFNIAKLVEDGRTINPTVKFQPGIISHPVPFQTDIKPRSPEHEKLIRAVEVEHPWEKSDSRYLKPFKL